MRIDDVARLVHPRVIELERHAPVEDVGHAGIHTPDGHTVLVPVECAWHALVVAAVDGGDALVEHVAIAHEGEVVAPVENSAVTDAVSTLGGEIEVVALLGLEVGIADNHIAHVAHVEVHEHLLERGCTEAAGIVGAEGHPWEFVDDGEPLGERTLRGGREVVVAQAGHDVQPRRDVPVELRIAVDVALRVAGVVAELIGGEVVVQVVGSQDEDVVAERVVIEGVSHVLAVGVVVVVGARAVGHVVGLVVLVVGIGQFQMAAVVPTVAPLESCTIAVEVIVVRIALAGAEEVAATASHRQPVGGTPDEPLLQVIGLLSIEPAQVGVVCQHRFIIRQSLRLLHQFDGNLLGRVRLRQVDGIDLGVLETRLRVPLPVVEGEAGSVAPFMPEGAVARMSICRPRLEVLAADDVDHAPYGIRAVECRRGSLHNLYAPGVFKAQTAVIDVVHRLASHALTIDKEEHGIAAEAAHVERRLLTHGESELKSGNLLNEHVLDIGGIGNLDVVKRDESRHYRGILQRLRCVRGRHHDGFQLHRVADVVLC